MDIVVDCIGLNKVYGSATALYPLTLQLARGEVLGYLGPNGAGKTTTIRLLLGLIKPSSGSANIFGLDCQKEKITIHKRIAYVPGEATLWPFLTGAETLHLLGKIHGSVDEQYKEELIKRFQFDPHKKVRTYSKGNRQKITLIGAFMTRAELLVLDEPTSGLDPLMEQVFRQTVHEAKSNGQTIFLSSHLLDEVEAVCDKVAILRAGKLVETGLLSEMRHLSSVAVEATFDNELPDISNVPGVAAVRISGKQVSCHVTGDIAPLLTILAASHPKTLLSREPSLEELFLSLYGEKETEIHE